MAPSYDVTFVKKFYFSGVLTKSSTFNFCFIFFLLSFILSCTISHFFSKDAWKDVILIVGCIVLLYCLVTAIVSFMQFA